MYFADRTDSKDACKSAGSDYDSSKLLDETNKAADQKTDDRKGDIKKDSSDAAATKKIDAWSNKDTASSAPKENYDKKTAEAVQDNLRALSHGTASRAVPLPPGSGLIWPIDENTGKPWSLERVREGLVSGSLLLDIQKGVSGSQNIDRTLNRAVSASSEGADSLSDARLKTALLHTSIELDRIFGEKVPPGWLPPADLIDQHGNLQTQRAQAYLARVGPWIDTLNRANAYYRAIQNLDEASKAGNHLMFSRIGEQSFAESLNLDENFPGTITLDPSTGRNKYNFAKPENLSGNPDDPSRESSTYYTDIQQRLNLEEWVRKVDAPVRQAVNEFASNKNQEHRLCFWGDMPGEGKTADNEKYNYTQYRTAAEAKKIKVTNPDGTETEENFVQVNTYRQRQWATPLSYQGWGWMQDVGKPEESGYATINGQKLESGKSFFIGKDGKSFLLERSSEAAVELRLTKDGRIQAKVLKNSENDSKKLAHISRINGLNSQEREYDLVSDKWIDIMAGDTFIVSGQKIDWQNDVRLYKPNDWVAMQDGNGHQIMQAKNLGSWIAESKLWHYGSRLSSLALDATMIATGTAELRALDYVGKKGIETITEEAVRRVAEQGGSKLLRRHAGKEIFLGASGLGRQAVENWGNWLGGGIDNPNLGHSIMSARDIMLMFDLTANNAGISSLNRRWGALMGKGSPELMGYYLKQGKTLEEIGKSVPWRQRAFNLNESVMKASGYVVDADMLQGAVRGVGDGLAETSERRRDATERTAKATDNLDDADATTMNRTSHKQRIDAIVSDLMTRLDPATKTQLQKDLAEVKAGQSELDKYIYQFNKPNSSHKEKVFSALALLKITEITEKGDYPVKFESSNGHDHISVNLSEIDTFLQSYRPIQLDSHDGKDSRQVFAQWATETGKNFKVENEQILLAEIGNSFNGAAEIIAKEKLKLLDIYNKPSSTQNEKLIAATGLLLLSCDRNGSNVASPLAEREGVRISVKAQVPMTGAGTGMSQTFSTIVFDGTDAKIAAEKFKEDLAREKGAYFAPDIYGQEITFSPVKEKLTAAEAVHALRDELTSTNSLPIPTRIATANLLKQLGQLSNSEMAALSLEIISAKTETAQAEADKAAAILELGAGGIAQILAEQKKVEMRALSEENEQVRSLRLAEIGNINSEHITNALLAFARDKQTDADVRALAISALSISNITDNKAREAAITDLSKTWRENSAKEGQFAQKAVAQWLSELNLPIDSKTMPQIERERLINARAQRQLLDLTPNSSNQPDTLADVFNNQSNSFARREKHFLAALSLYELRDCPGNLLMPDDKKKMYSTLLSCIRAEREDGKTLQLDAYKLDFKEQEQAIRIATTSSRYTQSQALDILFNNYDNLTKSEQKELIDKAVSIINLPSDGLHVDSEPALKITAMKQLDRIMPSRTLEERELYAHALEQNINTKIHYELAPLGSQGQQVVNDEIQLVQMSFAALCKLDRGVNQLATIDLATRLAKDTNADPHLRLASLDALSKMQAPDLHRLSNDLIKNEKDIVMRARLQNIIDSNESDESKARADLANSHTLQANEARKYLRSQFSDYLFAKNVFSYTPDGKAIDETLGFTGIGNRFNEADTSAIDNSVNYVSKLLQEHVGINIPNYRLTDEQKTPAQQLQDDFQKLIEKSKEDSIEGKEARNALAYIVLSNGEPFNQSLRSLAVEEAANGFDLISRYGSTEVKKQIAPLISQCLTDQPIMSRQIRQTVLNAYSNILYDPENIISRPEAARTLSTALQHEFRIMPRLADDAHRQGVMPKSDKDARWQESADLQSAFISHLSACATEEEIPLLIAIAGKTNGTANHPMTEIREAAQKILNDLKEKSGITIDPKTFNSVQLASYEEALKLMRSPTSTPSLIGLANSLTNTNWFQNANKAAYMGLDGEVQEDAVRRGADTTIDLFGLHIIPYRPDFEKFVENNYPLSGPFNKLRSDAISEAHLNDNIGSEARAAIAYVVLSNGSPLATEAGRKEMVNAAARTMGDIIKSNAPEAGEMLSLAIIALTEAPTLPPETRLILLDAIKSGVDNTGLSGKISQAQAASVITKALVQESKRVPAIGQEDHENSELLQTKYVQYLSELEYKPSKPIMRDLYNGKGEDRFKLELAKALHLPNDEIAHWQKRLEFSAKNNERSPQQRANAIIDTLRKPILDVNEKAQQISQVLQEECKPNSFPDLRHFSTDEFLSDPRVTILLQLGTVENKTLALNANLTLANIFKESGQLVPPSIISAIYQIGHNSNSRGKETGTGQVNNPLTTFASGTHKSQFYKTEAINAINALQKHYAVVAPEYWQNQVVPILRTVSAADNDNSTVFSASFPQNSHGPLDQDPQMLRVNNDTISSPAGLFGLHNPLNAEQHQVRTEIVHTNLTSSNLFKQFADEVKKLSSPVTIAYRSRKEGSSHVVGKKPTLLPHVTLTER